MDCGEPEEEHSWYISRRKAMARDGNKCVSCGSTEKLEVNHIEPRLGEGYGPGCHHHLKNLETLCRSCHRKVTNGQRGLWRNTVYIGDEVTVDSRRRVNLGQWRSPHTNLYTIETPSTGVIVLTPAVIVTDPEVVRGTG